MDSLTHIVLGATLGEVIGGRKLGKRALVFGAVAQSLPDIDFIAFLWATPAEDLLIHRGFTHSILFAMLSAIAMAWAAARWVPDKKLSLNAWVVFFAIQILTHDFLDTFNAYGTGLFEPFSHARISFHTLFVVDPFFTFPLLFAFTWLVFLKTDHRHRIKWAMAGLVASILYLGYAVSNKIVITDHVETRLVKENIQYQRFFSTPTALNTWLWWVVVENQDGFYVGFRSLLDKEPIFALNYFPKNDSLLDRIPDRDQVDQLKRFSQGYYTAEMRGDTLVFNDLRFGQNGWDNPTAPFVFNYYLTHPADNTIVIQRGRFAHWNRKRVNSFIRRIEGL